MCRNRTVLPSHLSGCRCTSCTKLNSALPEYTGSRMTPATAAQPSMGDPCRHAGKTSLVHQRLGDRQAGFHMQTHPIAMIPWQCAGEMVPEAALHIHNRDLPQTDTSLSPVSCATCCMNSSSSVRLMAYPAPLAWRTVTMSCALAPVLSPFRGSAGAFMLPKTVLPLCARTLQAACCLAVFGAATAVDVKSIQDRYLLRPVLLPCRPVAPECGRRSSRGHRRHRMPRSSSRTRQGGCPAPGQQLCRHCRRPEQGQDA